MGTAIKDMATGFGTIRYNGVTFGPIVKTDIVGEFVYDDAERMVKYVKYVLHVHTIVYSSSVANMNTTMDAVQDALSEPGRELVLQDIGFDIALSTAIGGSRQDIVWGAKPRVLQWVTLGHVAAEVTWVVEFNVSRCASPGTLSGNPFLSFNWGVTYAINEEGLTTRTITGSCEVPATRGPNGSRMVLFNVDAKWDRILVRVPFGFRRVNNTRTINAAKNRIDFTVADQQLAGEPFPAGLVNADLDYDFSNVNSQSFLQWVATLSGSLTVAPNQPPSLAAEWFFRILATKVAAIKTKTNNIFPMRCRVGHKPFTRTSRFSVTYMVTVSLPEILSTSGLWAPVPGTDYGTWAMSMSDVWSNRGNAKLRMNPIDDRLIDACVSFPQATIGTEGSQVELQQGSYNNTLFANPTQTNSWIAYSNDVTGVAEHNAVLHRYAQYITGNSYIPHTLQYQGAVDLYVIMHGWAKRLGYKPEVPALTSVGGSATQFLAESIDIPDAPLGWLLGTPLYFGKWSRLYRLSRNPSGVNLLFAQKRPSEDAGPTAPSDSGPIIGELTQSR